MTMTREEAKQMIESMGKYLSEGNPIWETEPIKEATRMAIEALSADMYCPNCGVRLVTENEYEEPQFYDEDDYWNGRVPTHGRLIDADALGKDLMKRWDINDDQDFCNKEVWEALRDAPTVHADRPHGEWIDVNGDGSIWRCNRCKDTACCDGNFCPNCGAIMENEDK